MTGKKLYVSFLVTFSLSVVFGRNDNFEYHFSEFDIHKNITTSDLVISSSQDENETIFSVNATLQQSGKQSSDPTGAIVGIVIFIVLVGGCIYCGCCPKCPSEGKRGFVVQREVLPQPVITQTEQPVAVFQHIPPEHTAEPVQQFAPQYHQPIFPPPNYSPMQQGHQYSPMQPQHLYSPVQTQMHYSPHHPGYDNAAMLQFHNLPEPPPPYETKQIN